MATIITKNSQTASAVPDAASLSVGELAVNTADGKLYTEHTGGVVKEIIPSTVVDGGITANKLASNAVTTAKIADANVTVAKISASGTPSSSTYLRGDGSWQAAGGLPGLTGQVFSSNGTYTIPSGVTRIKVSCYGGGGSGAGSNPELGSGGAGGSGAYSVKYLTGLTPGNTLSVTVGAGGAASGSTSSGNSGGTSSVASGTQSITTISGGGGGGGNYNGSGGSAGSASGGDLDINGVGGASRSSGGAQNISGISLSFLSIKSSTAVSGFGYGSGAANYGQNSTVGGAGRVIIEW
jgi:hypothetical protein